MDSQKPDLVPSPVDSRNQTLDSDDDQAAAKKRRLKRRSRVRSKDGCKTCRRRRVKCDEIKPRCGPCTRLGKKCSWRKRWRFYDLTAHTRTMNQDVFPMGSPSWGLTASETTLARQLEINPYTRDICFNRIDSEEVREEKALTEAPGTFYVILTLRTFSRLSGSHDMTTKHHECNRSCSRRILHHEPSSDPNVIFLTDFEEAGTWSTHPKRGRLLCNNPDRNANVALGPQDVCGGRNPNDQACLEHFRKHVHSKIVPLGSNLALDEDDGAEAMIRESQTFRAVSVN